MNRLSLRTLRTFVTVAECGSVSLAAEKLARSQAAVSATIAEFEKSLGMRVFVRKPAKGLMTTAIGEALSLEARGLLAHADEFEAIAGAMGAAVDGKLSVACFVNLAPVLVANMIAEFKKRYPKIDVDLQIANHETILESVRRGVAELAISFDLVPQEQFRSIELAALPPLVMLPANHALAGRKKVSLTELVGEPFVLTDLPHTREYFLSLFYSMKLDPLIKYRSPSLETARALVGNGLGYGLLNILPKAAATYDGTEVVNIPLAEELRPLKIVMFSPKQITQRRLVRTFAEFLRGYMLDWRRQHGLSK